MRSITMEEVIKLVNNSRREGIREGAEAMREACAAFCDEEARAFDAADLPETTPEQFVAMRRKAQDAAQMLRNYAGMIRAVPLPGDEPGKETT